MPAPPLYAFHRLLISAAIGLGILLLLYGLLRFTSAGDGWALVLGLAGAAAAGGLALYLRWFLRKKGLS